MKVKYESLVNDKDMKVDNSVRKVSDIDDEQRNLTSKTPFSKVPCSMIYSGLIYSATSSLFFSITRVIVKHLKNVHPAQLSVCRFFGIFLLSIPMVIKEGGDPLGPNDLRLFLILRGIVGATNLFLRFYSMQHLPIGEAAVIVSSVPVFVSIFACICLNESCGFVQSMAAILTMIGLTFIMKLPFLFDFVNHSSITHSTTSDLNTENDRLYGLIAAFSSTLFAASVFIILRKVKKAHQSIILFNFGWVAIIESVIIAAIFDGFTIPATIKEWFLMCLVAVFGFCGQYALTLSLKTEEAGPVSVVRAALDVTLTMIWQLLFFSEYPDIWTVIGTILVLGSVTVIGLRKWFLRFPEDSNIRRLCNI
ncbi:Solute carrier family 35 member G1-like protein [Leptotrombidium deliense]|uniref:Solute carrier family 35 member G1-like protein n=1 Tax=Leptotrombidium deliense TaxID=299467 RepID=A0A443SAC1_9ACAR|nr:Solute carrier family 35 member G1-like protein [Leptotrombidium deliense]